MDKINFILDNLPNFYDKESESNLYKILGSVSDELDLFLKKLDEVKNSKFIDYAQNEDLDKIALILNMKRFTTEDDDNFRSRIKSKVSSFIGGGTISALKQVVNNYLGVEPVIIEHYKSGEGHPYFDNGVINGLTTNKVNATNLTIKSGYAYTQGARYSLNDANLAIVPLGIQYAKYNLIEGNTLTKADYTNKIIGSVVENPHIARRGCYSSIAVPTNNFSGLSTDLLANDEYIKISKLDAAAKDSGGAANTSGNIGQMVFSFNLIEQIERNIGKIPVSTLTDKVAWLKANINKMTLNWHGFGANTIGNNVGTTDFAGKVAGSVTENANISKHNQNGIAHTTLLTPSNANFSEFNASNYTNLSSLNSVNAGVSVSLSGGISQTLFSFDLIAYIKKKYGVDVPGATTADKVAWLKANVSSINFNWHGYGSGPNGNKASIQIWDNATSSYPELAVSHTNSTVTKLTKTSNAAQITNRMDANGFIHYLAYADASNGTIASIINTDYVSLDITLKNTNKANLTFWASDAWQSLTTIDNNKVTKISRDVITSIPNAIQSDGYIHFITYTEASNGITSSFIYTDFVELEIYLNSSTYLTLETDNLVKKNQVLLSKIDSTTLANFSDKLSGSIIENPHIFKTKNSTTFDNPSTFVSEFSTSNYNYIKTINDLQYATTTRTGNGEIAQQLFSFNLIEEYKRKFGIDVPGADIAAKVAWLKSNINSILCNWHGYGLGPNGNKATFTAYYNNGWNGAGVIVSNTSATVSKLSLTMMNYLPNAIDANGFIHYLAYTDASNGTIASNIYTDYIELIVDWKDIYSITDNRNILNPEQHYITNASSITVQIPYNFTSSNIPLENVKDILRNTKAAGIALLIKIMDTYNENIQITENAHSYFLMGFSGIGGNNILGGK